MGKKLSHIDEKGKANMVDVGDKPIQQRIAVAQGKIVLLPKTIKLIQENSVKKGDVLSVAQIAGIQAAKKTSELIPLCHPLPLTKIEVIFKIMPFILKGADRTLIVFLTISLTSPGRPISENKIMSVSPPKRETISSSRKESVILFANSFNRISPTLGPCMSFILLNLFIPRMRDSLN